MTPTGEKPAPLAISSLANPRVKNVIRLRQRSHRDEADLMLIEGYREIKRAIDNGYAPAELFYCEALFQGSNEPALIAACADRGAALFQCSEPVFAKMAYRDRPEGLLAVGPQIHRTIDGVRFPDPCLLIVAEAIEKPGNLGTILRSADGAGAHAVLVCDKCTDIHNPNVVRASIGTLFSMPVIEMPSSTALAWLKEHGVRIVSASPHAEKVYTDADLTKSTAIVVGTEQYGLSKTWMENADEQLRIPMLGQSDSLNVAQAVTLLLYEAVRQRSDARPAFPDVDTPRANGTEQAVVRTRSTRAPSRVDRRSRL